MEAVEPLHRVGRLQRPEAAVEAGEELFAAFQVAEREAVGERDALGPEGPSIGVALDLERAGGRAGVARSDAGRSLSERVERHVGRQPRSRRQDLRRERSQGRIIDRRARPVARGHVGRPRPVRRDRVAERPDQGASVHDLRQPRHGLGDRDARRGGGDGPELAADLLHGLGLGVPHVDRRRATGQPDLDDAGRDLPRSGRPLAEGLRPEGVGQREAEQAGRADPEEIAAMEPLAVGLRSRHGRSPPSQGSKINGSARIRAY